MYRCEIKFKQTNIFFSCIIVLWNYIFTINIKSFTEKSGLCALLTFNHTLLSFYIQNYTKELMIFQPRYSFYISKPLLLIRNTPNFRRQSHSIVLNYLKAIGSNYLKALNYLL